MGQDPNTKFSTAALGKRSVFLYKTIEYESVSRSRYIAYDILKRSEDKFKQKSFPTCDHACDVRYNTSRDTSIFSRFSTHAHHRIVITDLRLWNMRSSY
jgi:hypothetical protein